MAARRPRQRKAGPGSAAALREAAGRLGIEKLHPEQERVIGDVLAGRDVLMVLPTGFGKSACYQLPSMLLPKPVVLISPLLALLRDQQQKLVERDVPCVRLDGTVRGARRRAALERIAEGGSLLVMTTPETLAGAEARDALAKSGVSLLAVDEAHCLSEWGHDFRPAYLRLGALLPSLGGPPVLALTATATPRVRTAIVGSLRMRKPSVVASSPHRANLAFEVIPCEGDLRPRALLRLARRLRRPGIVYCATRGDVDLVYTLLRRFDFPAHRYHGGMTATERNREQEHFMQPGQRTTMVATSAFGLGIDKPDIRYVLHYQAPAALEQYVQEAGRGGRDGKKANAILLFDPEADRPIHEALLTRGRVRPEQLYRLGTALAAWAAETRTPTLEALALSAELGPRTTAALLAKVEEAGLAEREEADVRILASANSIEEEVRALAGQFETLRTMDGRRLDAMEAYGESDGCRARSLRAYFGEEDDEPCGLCDVCQGRPRRSDAFFAPLVAPRKKRRGKTSGRRGRGRRKATRKEGEAPGKKTPGKGGTRGKPTRKRRGARRKASAADAEPNRKASAPEAESNRKVTTTEAESNRKVTRKDGEAPGKPDQSRRRRGRRGGRRARRRPKE
ncbi:MAG: ATP-dependent DNA helicase RecQ [Deltaproteobacteria bacterium]|nr:ATP-dependent DNA helicase RecQ [Deltaproteobacteria bacterium]